MRFARPIRFGNGQELDTFIFQARSTFTDLAGAGRYRIRNWRARDDYEITGPPRP